MNKRSEVCEVLSTSKCDTCKDERRDDLILRIRELEQTLGDLRKLSDSTLGMVTTQRNTYRQALVALRTVYPFGSAGLDGSSEARFVGVIDDLIKWED
jgi:hypothetical protein